MPRNALIPLILIATALAVALGGCATGPRFDSKVYDKTVAPAQAVQDNGTLKGAHLLWGGLIIATRNLEQGTEIEILGYPLGPSQKPDTGKAPSGRFIAVSSEYLESVDYAEGRLVTVAGIFNGTRDGMVGEARYVYPVIEPEVGQVYLWPPGDRGEPTPKFSIGVGVLFGR